MHGGLYWLIVRRSILMRGQTGLSKIFFIRTHTNIHEKWAEVVDAKEAICVYGSGRVSSTWTLWSGSDPRNIKNILLIVLKLSDVRDKSHPLRRRRRRDLSLSLSLFEESWVCFVCTLQLQTRWICKPKEEHVELIYGQRNFECELQ